MNKRNIVKKVLSELNEKGLLNKKAVRKYIKEANGLDITQQVQEGDLVDFGPYGKKYVVAKSSSTTGMWWVTDKEEDRVNPDALGWYIEPTYAKRIIEKYDDEDDDDFDFLSEAKENSILKKVKQALNGLGITFFSGNPSLYESGVLVGQVVTSKNETIFQVKSRKAIKAINSVLKQIGFQAQTLDLNGLRGVWEGGGFVIEVKEASSYTQEYPNDKYTGEYHYLEIMIQQ